MAQTILPRPSKSYFLSNPKVRGPNILEQIQIIIFSYVSHYSTTSTSEAAYIIGGSPGDGQNYFTITEYKNNAWKQMGTLKNGRRYHGSISLDDEIMVIGGDDWTSQDELVYFYDQN